MRQKRWLLFLIGPPALWLIILFVVPLLTMVVFTFRAGSFGLERETLTLSHYQVFFNNAAYQRLFLSSTVIAFIVALLSVVLAYPIAYFLAFQAGPWKVTLLLLIVVPGWISFLLRVFAWKLLLGSGGLINSFLMMVGFIEEPSPILLYSRPAVVLALVYVYVPFIALPIFVALERIDRSLIEAAIDLGCSARQTFLRVILPLSMPGVWAGFFLVFIPTLGEYVTPLLVGGTQSMMYGNVIQNQFTRALNWPLGSLMSVTMLLITLLMLLLFSRYARLNLGVKF